jgi:hypothetical protein
VKRDRAGLAGSGDQRDGRGGLGARNGTVAEVGDLGEYVGRITVDQEHLREVLVQGGQIHHGRHSSLVKVRT